MSKVMVVEDDASLREIYGIRIAAEGYEVVSAGDGEEALAMAVREKPNLILSDVMMPKISGFDMLDILRATPETAKIKIIMMTALSGDDQRQRGERLGADRYLVKSQVGIEDVINVIHEVMGDKNGATPPPATAETTSHTVIAVSTQETTPDMDSLAQKLAADAEAQSHPQPSPAPTATPETTPASTATPTPTMAPAEAATPASSTDATASDAPAAAAAPAPEANSATATVATPAADPVSAPSAAGESTATPEMAPPSAENSAAPAQPAAEPAGPNVA